MSGYPSIERARGLALAAAAGLVIASSAALAQDDGPYGPPPGYDNGPPPGYDNGPPVQEEVPVIAPRFRMESRRLGEPPGTMSLAAAVHYDDLDLTTRYGAHALKMRIREAAHDVCGQLADAYPVHQLPFTSCYKTAMQNALVRADEAITTARQEFRYDTGYERY